MPCTYFSLHCKFCPFTLPLQTKTGSRCSYRETKNGFVGCFVFKFSSKLFSLPLFTNIAGENVSFLNLFISQSEYTFRIFFASTDCCLTLNCRTKWIVHNFFHCLDSFGCVFFCLFFAKGSQQ